MNSPNPVPCPLPEAGPAVARGRPDADPGRTGRLRSLAPKEHGAYGQLALPLCAGLAMGRPGLSSIAIATGAVLAFVAHEPALLLLGQRGSRARREDGARAARRLVLLGGIALGGGALGLALAPTSARLAAIVPLVLGGLLVPFIARNAERTLPGELIAAAALSSVGIPVALAAGAPAGAAWGAWAAFCLAFGASTFGVRAVVAQARNPVAWPQRVFGPVITLTATAVLAAAGALSPAGALGASPMLVLALAIAVAPPRPVALKRVGWALVASSVILCAALAVGAHL